MNDISLEELKEKAFSLKWDDIGITAAKIPDQDIAAYRQWLSNGRQAEMAYMENQIRCFPEELLPGAQTAIIFITYYKQAKYTPQGGLIASYARGRDYHHVHRKRLKTFITWLEERSGKEGIAKGFSDSTPILEKALAVQAGLGWLGKNTLLIHRRFGTFTLLSGILTKLALPHTSNKQLTMHIPRCGSCTCCLDACPTNALVSPYVLDARRCLSYHLIESKQPIPKEIQEKNPGYAFGCDICQDVCPHNIKKPESNLPEFAPTSGMGVHLDKERMNDILEHPETLHGTPLQRKGAQGLLANYLSLQR